MDGQLRICLYIDVTESIPIHMHTQHPLDHSVHPGEVAHAPSTSLEKDETRTVAGRSEPARWLNV